VEGLNPAILDRLVLDAVEASLRETLQAALESGVTQPEGAQRWLDAKWDLACPFRRCTRQQTSACDHRRTPRRLKRC